jgi:hypothetical protein
VDRQRQLGVAAGVLDQPVDGVGGERRPALSGEHVAVVGERLAQRRQHPPLIAPDRVNTGLAALALQLLCWEMSESMGNHDSNVVGAGRVC